MLIAYISIAVVIGLLTFVLSKRAKSRTALRITAAVVMAALWPLFAAMTAIGMVIQFFQKKY